VTDADIVVRPCHLLVEFESMVDLQSEVWGYSDRDVVPLHMFVVADSTGGGVIGAFINQRLIGFTLAYGAVRDGEAYLHSHLAAVRPQYRHLGVGQRLKLAQREEALSRRIQVIEWTFDPLQPKNAYFNICRLGAIICRYLPNLYGATSSWLHHGLPTDRLVAEWHLSSERVSQAIQGEAPALGPTVERIEIPSPHLEPDLPALQTALRERFQHLFASNYCVTWFERNGNGGAYLLEPLQHAA
jgi:predicted GNAT superfamily acetyltransferase